MGVLQTQQSLSHIDISVLQSLQTFDGGGLCFRVFGLCHGLIHHGSQSFFRQCGQVFKEILTDVAQEGRNLGVVYILALPLSVLLIYIS